MSIVHHLWFNLLNQNLSGLDPIRGSNDSFLLHLFDDSGRSIITNSKSPLDEGDGSLSGLGHKGHGFIIFLVEFLLFSTCPLFFLFRLGENRRI
jgi:hypothetical protein